MNGGRKLTIVLVMVFFVFLGIAAWIENASYQTYELESFQYRLTLDMEKSTVYGLFPVLGYCNETIWEKDKSLQQQIYYEGMPLFVYMEEKQSLAKITEDDALSEYLLSLEAEHFDNVSEKTEGVVLSSDYYEDMISENSHAVIFTQSRDFFTAGCGFISEISSVWVSEFEKATVKSVNYEHDKLLDYEFATENFYTVDACTSAGPELLNPEELLAYDVTVDKSLEGPHILIYHTHSQEAFADSVPGDKSTTIVGAGEKLADLLREEYGYEVYHHTGEYDVDTRDDAYAKAAPALEEILARYPQIQVIIDLHRDGVDESRHLVADWKGKQVAQFMFFNGLSYLNTKGKIEYLPNENLKGNLALSYQAVITANEYYPGVVRRTYLNGYRYNMHYRDKTMLIELGAQTNTVDEIMNACEPLAHILDMVLSGKEND